MSLEGPVDINTYEWKKNTLSDFSTVVPSECIKILEIWEIDNILSQYNFNTLIRFPWIVIECFLDKKIPLSELQKYNCSIEQPIESIKCLSKRLQKWDKCYKNELHLCADRHIVLYYEDLPIATIWFQGNIVSEIQSRKVYSAIKSPENHITYDYNKRICLEWFNWKKVLIKLTEEYCKNNWETEIMVKWAVFNRWSNINSNCLPGQRGYKIYDQPCIELWYQTEYKEIPWHWKIALIHKKDLSS